MSLTDQPASPPPRSGIRNILPYTTVLMVIVAVYVAWTLFSRYESTKEANQAAQDKAARNERERNAQITQNGSLTFTTFYASDAVIKRGGTTRLCYGVMNAKSVKIDPAVEQLQPTERHCLDIAPKQTTTYKITAEGDSGQTKSLSVTVRVE